MKNNKGYTLIELLTAIVILGIITGMSFPVLTVLRNRNETKKYEMYGETLISAAKLYVDSNEKDLNIKDGDWIEITYERLKEKNLIKDININGITCNSNRTTVIVKNANGKYKYSYNLACGPKKASGDPLTNIDEFTYFNNKKIVDGKETPIDKIEFINQTVKKNDDKPPIIDSYEVETSSEIKDLNSRKVLIKINARDVYNENNQDNHQLYFCVSIDPNECKNSGTYKKMNFEQDEIIENNNTKIKYKKYNVTNYIYNTNHSYNGEKFNIYVIVKDSSGNFIESSCDYEIFNCPTIKKNIFYGDVNNDKKIDEEDYNIIRRYNVQMDVGEINLAAADVNLDGAVDVTDGTIIARYVIGTTPSLPWPYGLGDDSITKYNMCEGNQ